MMDKSWWKETVFYEIYMPSYKDSNGDGYSDFKGLTSKLGYIKSLGVKGIWLTPFLQSPKVDNGYDISNYYQIDPTYGHLEDFCEFIDAAHHHGIKVIMDLVLNHTSTESSWFQEAKLSAQNPYRDYYIWRDTPNNWESFFGGSAWEYEPRTRQYYYHKFDVTMADLNWQNPELIREIKRVLRFWLDLGVDGFRLDVINFLTTEGITFDNPTKEDGSQEHLHDINQKGVKDAIRKIRTTVDQYENRFLVGEIGSEKLDVIKQYQGPDLLDVVFNFNLGSISEFSVQRIFDELKSMHEQMHGFPTLFFGSHDMPRLINRLAHNNPDRAEALAALMLTAKGVPFIYYGDEIGMENIVAHSIDEIKDIQGRTRYELAIEKGKSKEQALETGNKFNRDKSRSPMQWDDSDHAGFSTRPPWIKVHENYPSKNVSALKDKKHSLLQSYKQLIALRNSEPILQYGEYQDLSLTDGVISFTRTLDGNSLKCFFNFGEDLKQITLEKNEQIIVGELPLEPDRYVIIG